MTDVKLQTCNFACFGPPNARGTTRLCPFPTETCRIIHSRRKICSSMPQDAVDRSTSDQHDYADLPCRTHSINTFDEPSSSSFLFQQPFSRQHADPQNKKHRATSNELNIATAIENSTTKLQQQSPRNKKNYSLPSPKPRVSLMNYLMSTQPSLMDTPSISPEGPSKKTKRSTKRQAKPSPVMPSITVNF